MRQLLIKKLYRILDDHSNYQEYQYLRDPIPEHFICGIYFFFDTVNPINQKQYKITYIGITKDNNNNRLKKHQSNNNSASIFRKHIDGALNYNQDLIGKKHINEYIHNLPYLFINIDNIYKLKLIEKKTIELISNYNKTEEIDIPSKNWLGFNHKRDIIKKAHIWNIHYSAGKYSEEYNYDKVLEYFKEYSIRMKNT